MSDALADTLVRLLDAAPRRSELEALSRAVGGWVGLQRSGPEALLGALDDSWRVRVEALFELVEAWHAIEPLPAVIDGPEGLLQRVRPQLAHATVETFWVASLDARSRLIGLEQVSMGTLTACLVHPREVFAPALRIRAASIVVIHNHPSGDPEPSDEDVSLTERLVSAGRLLGIPLVDHLVVARGGLRSVLDADAA